MIINRAWFYAVTAPFKGRCDNVEPAEEFDPGMMSRMYRMSVADATVLAKAASLWLATVQELPFTDEFKSQLRMCTMQFSHWRCTKYKKDGVDHSWRRTVWYCKSVKICPWCRHRAKFQLTAALLPLAKAGILSVYERSGDPADRKALSRAPEHSVAALRNVVYSAAGNPQFRSLFFFNAEAKPVSAYTCDEDTLHSIMADLFSWDLIYPITHGILSEHLQLMEHTRMWSLSKNLKTQTC